MGGMEVFQAQDVNRVAFKPPPPPVQQPEMVQAQDIATTPPPAEDIKEIETGKGKPSEIAVVVPTVTVAAPPPPKDDWLTQPDKPAEVKPTEPPKAEETKPKKKKNFFDKIGDFLKKHKKEIAVGTAIVGGIVAGGGQTETPKTDKPKDPEKPKETPKTEKPKEPEKPKQEEKPIPASGRTFKTQGDPIVKTGDGLQYSMNVPGTYLSLKSKSGDFEMKQTVTETPGHRHYNTGMDFHVGKNNISFDANGGKNPATMTINGQKVDLKYTAFSKTLDDGTKVSYDPKTNKVNITSPEGDKVTVQRSWNDQKTHYLNATVELSEKRPAGSVFGALGTLDADNDAKNDARMRDGSVYKGPIGDLWKTPEDFLKEWRVGK